MVQRGVASVGKPGLAVLEGLKNVNGFWNEGGTLWSTIGWLSSTLNQATGWIVNWAHDSLKVSLGHNDTEKVLYFYTQGLSKNELSKFQGLSDPNLNTVLSYLVSKTGLSEDVVNNVMQGLYQGSVKGSSSCTTILGGGGITPLDTLAFEGPTSAVANTVNSALSTVASSVGMDLGTLKTILYGVGGVAALILLYNLYMNTGGARRASRPALQLQNPRRSLREWIRENRKEIDEAIRRAVPDARIDDEERRLWILNDEGLYNWARSEGVRI